MAKIYGADGLPKLLKGYPTQTNLIDIQGGLLGGSDEVKFGDVVIFDTQAGYYKKFVSGKTVADLAGIVAATNVKLVPTWPAGTAEAGFRVGEAINLLPLKKANVGGYIAVELGNPATANIVEGKKVAIWLTGDYAGKLTTTGATYTPSGGSAITATDLDGVYFTGIYENKGTTAAPVYVAEIVVNG